MEFLIPSRAARGGDDLIFALNTEASARRAAGESIINATVGMILDDQGKLAVMEAVPRVLREQSAALGAAYPPIAGSADFRRAVALDLFGADPIASAAVVLATPGGCGALRHSVASFLEPGQAVLTSSFYWGPYETIADELDRRVATFRLFDERGRFDAADLERSLAGVMETQGRALLFLNTPCHNPTGYSLDRDDWARAIEVIERAARRGPVAVLLDVAYARYGVDDLSETTSCLLRLAGKAMLLFAWSASKSFTQYGMRVGALVAVHPDPNMRAAVEATLSASSRGTWSCCNASGMAAIARVILDPELRAGADAERAELRAMLDRRSALFHELAEGAGLRRPRYSGGFFSTIFCDDAPGVAARLRADGVFVVPMQGGLRVALSSVAERDVPRLVSAIAGRIASGGARAELG